MTSKIIGMVDELTTLEDDLDALQALESDLWKNTENRYVYKTFAGHDRARLPINRIMVLVMDLIKENKARTKQILDKLERLEENL